jgi:hypothetical protein
MVLVTVASAVLLVEVAAGAALRAIEVNRSLNEKFVLNGYKKFLLQGPSKAQQLLPVNSVIAGDEEFCDLASIATGVRPLAGYAAFLSLGVDDQEWESREALNAHIEGLSEREFRSKARDARRPYGWGESADRQRAAMAEAGMMQEFARMEGDPRPWIKAFGVSYVAIQATEPDPDYLKRGWSLIEAGPYWRIWRKN